MIICLKKNGESLEFEGLEGLYFSPDNLVLDFKNGERKEIPYEDVKEYIKKLMDDEDNDLFSGLRSLMIFENDNEFRQ